MAKIPIPATGVPLDTEIIGQIIAQLNNLSDQISRATYRYTTIKTRNAGEQSVRTGDARIKGGYVSLADSNVKVGDRAQWSYSLGSDFKYTPIVVATPVHVGSGAAPNVSVIITSVTTQAVNGVVIFEMAGRVNIDINILAIGIPN